MEFDPIRMLVGDFAWEFTLEIVLRTVIMYTYTLAIVRVLGKRGLGHLSPFELVIIVALGSSVGDPMFYARCAPIARDNRDHRGGGDAAGTRGNHRAVAPT